MVFLIALALVGCGFSGHGDTGPSASDGPAGIDAQHPSDPDAMIEVDGQLLDAPMAPDSPPPPHTCAGYQTVAAAGTSSTYRKFNQATTFALAKAQCESDTAYLVIPETNAEAKAVFAFVDPDETSPYYWAGVADLDHDGVWTTVLGTTFANPPWAAMQPNGAGAVAVLVGSTGAFYDFTADAGQEYACECAP